MKGNQNAKKDGVAEVDEVETLKTNLNKLLQDKTTKKLMIYNIFFHFIVQRKQKSIIFAKLKFRTRSSIG